MKKLLLFTAALSIFSGVYAKKVKFQVDMTGQTVGGTGVHIAGNFQKAAGAPNDWEPNTTAMSNGGSGNIYSVIVDIPAHAKYEFKFINGDAWGGAESVPALNQVGNQTTNKGSNDNRWWFIDSLANDTSVLPAIKFSGEAPANKVALRFALDMQMLSAIDAAGVHIAGSLQAWNPAGTTMVNLFSTNKVYEYIAYVDTGDYQYKFVNGDAWGKDESVPSACVSGGNRAYHAAVSGVVPVVCYAMCVACPTAPLPRYSASFIVDMANTDCDGGFDSVTVAGSRAELTNWGSGVKMFNIPTTTYYALVLQLDSGEVDFKFRYHKNGNTNWEGGDNRVWILSSADTTDLNCFGLRVPCAAKPAPSTITFRVDMTNETPDPQGRIYVMGTFHTPNWEAGAVRMSQVSGHPGVFEATVTGVCPGKFEYKFANGDSSVVSSQESFPDTTSRACLEPSGVGGFNRSYTRTVTTPVTLAYVYNRCDAMSTTGIDNINALANNVKLFPNPAKEFATVEFNDKAASHTVSVYNIAGKLLAQYSNVKGNSVKLDKETIGEGLFLVNVSNSNGESKVLKLIIQ